MAAGMKVENVEKMRAQYARGDSIRQLAIQYDCCRQTVVRWCRDIERPAPSKPLTTQQRSELFRNWGRPT